VTPLIKRFWQIRIGIGQILVATPVSRSQMWQSSGAAASVECKNPSRYLTFKLSEGAKNFYR